MCLLSLGSHSIQELAGQADGHIDVQTTFLCPLYQTEWRQKIRLELFTCFKSVYTFYGFVGLEVYCVVFVRRDVDINER